MKRQIILLLLFLVFALNSCIIDSSERGLLPTDTAAGYKIYQNNEWLTKRAILEFSMLLTIDGYLSCKDQDLRDKIYKPHMLYTEITEISTGVYWIYHDKTPIYHLETGNQSLTGQGAKWELTDINPYSTGRYTIHTVTLTNTNEWSFRSNEFKTETNGELTTVVFNYMIICNKNEVTPEILLRELEVSGELKWHNSITVDCKTTKPLIYRELSNNFSFNGEICAPGHIIDGDMSILAGRTNDHRKYMIQSETRTHGSEIIVQISLNGEKELFKNN